MSREAARSQGRRQTGVEQDQECPIGRRRAPVNRGREAMGDTDRPVRQCDAITIELRRGSVELERHGHGGSAAKRRSGDDAKDGRVGIRPGLEPKGDRFAVRARTDQRKMRDRFAAHPSPLGPERQAAVVLGRERDRGRQDGEPGQSWRSTMRPARRAALFRDLRRCCAVRLDPPFGPGGFDLSALKGAAVACAAGLAARRTHRCRNRPVERRGGDPP